MSPSQVREPQYRLQETRARFSRQAEQALQKLECPQVLAKAILRALHARPPNTARHKQPACRTGRQQATRTLPVLVDRLSSPPLRRASIWIRFRGWFWGWFWGYAVSTRD